jgi:acetyl esterase/lipase
MVSRSFCRTRVSRSGGLWAVAIALTWILATAPVRLSAEPAAPAPPAPVKLPAGVRVERDIPYVPEADTAQRLDIYLPEPAPDHPLPLIVHIHGGGWRGGSKYPCPVTSMATRGYIVASVEYRFSQKALFPAQIQDCQAAIRWLRANQVRYHIDPDHVGVVGSSAGGHLSALVGTAGGKGAFAFIGGNDTQSDRVQAVCNYYGPADFGSVMQQAADDPNIRNIFKFNTATDPYSSLIGSSLDSDPAKTSAVSPVHYVSADNPPFLILHGTYDALVPYAQSVELADALKAKGVEVWLQKLPGSGHGGPAFSKPAVGMLIQNFFDKHLKGTEVTLALVPEEELAVPPPSPSVK